VDRLRDDSALLNHVGVDAVPDTHSGVLVLPLQQAHVLVDGNVGLLERLVLRQLIGEHLRELSYALVTSERSTVDENDDVLGHIPPKVLVEDVIESDVHPVVRKVQVVIKHFLRGAAAQILHDRLLLSSLPTHILRIVGQLGKAHEWRIGSGR